MEFYHRNFFHRYHVEEVNKGDMRNGVFRQKIWTREFMKI